MRPEPRNKRPSHKVNTERKGQNAEEPATHQTEGKEEDIREDYLLNRNMVPYVTGKFLGCDITMDDDQIVKEA